MSNKLVTLESRDTGAVYFKLGLKFSGGKLTMTEEKLKKLREDMKEKHCEHLWNREFGLAGSIKNAAVIQPIETVRGLDKASQEMSSPRSKPELSVDSHIQQLDEERLGAPSQAKTTAPSDEHIDPDEAQRLINEQADTERLVNEQAKIDAEQRQKSREAARARQKAEREAKKAQTR